LKEDGGFDDVQERERARFIGERSCENLAADDRRERPTTR